MKDGWDKPLTDWMDVVEKYTNDEIHRMTTGAFESIKEKTPVDSGRLQAAWFVKEMMSQGIISTEIINEEEYVIFIEYGNSKVAGRYMVETTLNQLIEGTI